MNDKVTMRRDDGTAGEAVAPVIISASRSTDIPAFYAEWFIKRLRAGYCVWYNPFNQQPQYVSFKNCKVVVFWTKNPAPIIPYLHELDERGIRYYFQFTLNDYVAEEFEPNVPSVEERIDTFKKLSDMIGRDRVIWRFDPLIVPPGKTVRYLLSKIWHIGNKLKGLTNKLVFSFIDVKTYRKVQNNLIKETGFYTRESIDVAEPTQSQIEEIADGLAKLRDAWSADGWNIELATCGEKVDLSKYGIAHNRCIDGELMERLWPNDTELVYYLHTGKLPGSNLLFGNSEIPASKKNLKDKGQRLACGCMVSKDIGMYNTCRHFCVYCYANTSKDVVMRNKEKHSEFSESIIE